MLIRRCAWHRAYRGYPMAFGIASWRGFRVSFTDGMCVGCAARFRRQWNLPAMPMVAPGFGLVRVAATLVVVTGLVLTARSLDVARAPATRTAPPETVLVPSPVDDDSMPALSIPHTPRRARATAVSSRRIPSPTSATVAQPSGASDSSVVLTAAAPEPVVASEPIFASDTKIEPAGAPAAARRFPGAPAFAALPHAGLTQQTP